MEPDNSHPPVFTHKKKKSKYHQRISPELFVPPTTQNSAEQASSQSTRVEKSSIRDAPDFLPFKMFPQQIGLFPYGTSEKGFEYLRIRMLDPQNTDSKTTKLLVDLDKLYRKAIYIYDVLHPHGLQNQTRRFLSKSDEQGGLHGNPSRSLHNISSEILTVEIYYKKHREVKDLELETKKIDKNLLSAIDIANKGILINVLGDYYGALSNDFRDNPAFSKPDERAKWSFMGFTKISQLIDAYDSEQESISKSLTPLLPDETPITASFHEANKYLDFRYKSVEEIIFFLRGYAEKNIHVHPVKELFEAGNWFGLKRHILGDYRTSHFLGDSPKSLELQEEVKRVLSLVVSRFFDEFEWDDDGFAIPGPSLLRLRMKYEKKTGIFVKEAEANDIVEAEAISRKENEDNDQFADDVFETAENEEERKLSGEKILLEIKANLQEELKKGQKKGGHTREKSLANENTKLKIMGDEERYNAAMQQCPGTFVRSVLQEMRSEIVKAKDESRVHAEEARSFEKRFNQVSESSKKGIARLEKKLQKKDEEVAALRSQLDELKKVA